MKEWVDLGHLLSFPHGWQRPAKTEEWIYETLIESGKFYKSIEFISFPWATLIDLIDRNQLQKAEIYIQALRTIRPKKTLIRVTACQHVNPNSVLSLMRDIGITDLFWSHKSLSLDLMGSIRIHPLALYPVAYFESIDRRKKLPMDRKYLFSFIGAYDSECYLSEIRKKIFSIPCDDQIFIKRREAWHFEKQVYAAQIYGEDLKEEEVISEQSKMIEYTEVLSESFFSLCPSGSGPNSIRYWESLAFGCVPLVLSDSLEIPLFGQMHQRVPEERLVQVIPELTMDKMRVLNGGFVNSSLVNHFLSNLLLFLGCQK